MTSVPRARERLERGLRSLVAHDVITVLLFALGALMIAFISRLAFLSQDANWDLLNYHAYNPASILDGTWFHDLHPAGQPSFITPYQDLVTYPVISILPAPIATALIAAVQLSICIPVGLILQTVVPDLTKRRAIAIGLIGISGAMFLTELGATMGDVPPAIPIAWGLWLLLSEMTGEHRHPRLRMLLAGILVGSSVALKLTMAYVAPGILVVVAALAVAGKWRSALIFSVTAPIAAIVLYAPWGLVLQANFGSPLFPFYNTIFNAPRYPSEDISDGRFLVTGLVDLIKLPLHLAKGIASTAEMPFADVRWLLAFVAAATGVGVAALRGVVFRRWNGWRDQLPRLALLGFWIPSFFVWGHSFGIQRYAMILEVLALPVMAVGLVLALPRLPRPISLLALLVVAAILARTTTIVDFGRRPMTWAPLFPTETIEPLARYDAVVTGGAPLAFLGAVTRDAPGASNQIWAGNPFNTADQAVFLERLHGKKVGVVFYADQRDAGVGAAGFLGMKLTDDCASFTNPLSSQYIGSTLEVCTAVPEP